MKRDEFGLPQRTMIVGGICVADVVLFAAYILFVLWFLFAFPNLR